MVLQVNGQSRRWTAEGTAMSQAEICKQDTGAKGKESFRI